jgi:hypothetical protein
MTGGVENQTCQPRTHHVQAGLVCEVWGFSQSAVVSGEG